MATAYDENLNELLTMGIEDAPPPKTLPAGLWQFDIDDVSLFAANKDKPGGLLFRLVPTVPGEDVDPEAADEYLESKDKPVEFHRVPLKSTDDVFKLGKLLAAIGADTAGKSVKDAAMETVGNSISAIASYSPNKENPDQPWLRLKGWGLPFAQTDEGEDDEAPF